MSTVVPLSDDLYEQALHLRPSSDQEKWSGTAGTILIRAKANPTQHVFLILDDEEPAGIFVLDTAPSIPLPGIDLQLHSFFIDQRLQGRGLATDAIAQIESVIRTYFPAIHLLGLAVNVQNPIAYRLYRVHGFTEADQKYLGGSRGPEHMLSMAF